MGHKGGAGLTSFSLRLRTPSHLSHPRSQCRHRCGRPTHRTRTRARARTRTRTLSLTECAGDPDPALGRVIAPRLSEPRLRPRRRRSRPGGQVRTCRTARVRRVGLDVLVVIPVVPAFLLLLLLRVRATPRSAGRITSARRTGILEDDGFIPDQAKPVFEPFFRLVLRLC